MNRRGRLIIYGACALAIAASFGAYFATGARGFTRYPTEQTRAINQEQELGELFEETGLNEELGEMKEVSNEFAFGLLPSGPGRGAISVVTVCLPALLVAGGAWYAGRRSTNRQPKMKGDGAGR